MNLIKAAILVAWALGMGFLLGYISNNNEQLKPKTEQIDSLSSFSYSDVKQKGNLRLMDKDGSITVYEYKKGDRVYTVFTSEYDYINAVREK